MAVAPDAGGSAQIETELHQQFQAAFRRENVTVDQVKGQFVQLWPQVKQGLDLLRQLSGVIPGVGGTISVVIGIVVAAGDAAFRALGGGG